MSHPDQIAGYNIQAVLGYGAHSTLYVAQDPKTGTLYALKRVVREGPDDQRFLDQTANEFEVAQQINHPAVRKCIELKKVRHLLKVSELHLIMELVDGQSLVQQQPRSLADQIKVFKATAEGLHAMHRAGFVHADIKPNNIILTDQGQVKLIDLGQSCRIGAVKERIQGTPDYIAPEQVAREPLGAATDVYNLGATMYWCVTGEHVPTVIPKGQPLGEAAPVRPENQLSTAALVGQPAKVRPPIELNPELPVALNNLIMQSLAAQAYERPQSMNDVHVRLKIAEQQLGRKWSKGVLLQAFTDACSRRDYDRAASLLMEMDQYLSPEEAKPYMAKAQDVLRKVKDQWGERFKKFISEKNWAEAIKMGRQIMKAFPNTVFADEVRKMMPRLKKLAAPRPAAAPAAPQPAAGQGV